MDSYAQIILPLSVADTFTYHIPKEFLTQIDIGFRAVVEFNGKKLYTGIVESIHTNKPENYSVKPIISLLDTQPIVTKEQLDLWKFISEYYMCSLGEVYRDAIPSALKLESETYIRLRDVKNVNLENLDEFETLIIQNLINKTSLNVKEIESFIPKKNILSALKYLYENKYLEIDEKITPKYTRKQLAFVKLHSNLEQNPTNLKEILLQIDKIDKQRNLLLQFLSIKNQTNKPIQKKELLEKTNSSLAILKALEKKQILEVYYSNIDRISFQDKTTEKLTTLTQAQQKANNEITKYFTNKKNVLLYGVSSSGKTEIYFHQIENQLKNGKQVLLLLPEISIATQIIHRVQKIFGEQVGIYHQKLSTNEKVEVWMNSLLGKYNIIIGTQNSIYLPFLNLGLIIVDEEHDSKYKKNNSKPCFNTRDCALYLANYFSANCLLGTATPSLESIYSTQKRKLEIVKLTERYGNTYSPEIELISLRNTSQENEIIGDFSVKLKNEIEETLNKKQQVLIFMNRRGFSPILECETCGFSPNCPNCNVNLTYHKFSNDLKCHYCGYKESKTKNCKVCNSPKITTKGIGTQSIEEQLVDLFHSKKIERMDLDTMRRKNAYEKLFEKMNLKEIDILVGTQMMSKGLDFDSIGLVGIIRADSLLQLSDFRAEEKAMQLIIQLCGRTGRKSNIGKVLIQTYNENSDFFQHLKNNEINLIYKKLLNERKEFNYPPYSKLIEITLKHKKQEKVRSTSIFLTQILTKGIDEKYILGPVEPEVNKINNVYINKITVKLPHVFSPSKTKKFIQESINYLQEYKATKQTQVFVNVDPN
ncbi:MAG: primosomal protein N' [Flavobacteriales bacterium]|nr:primosomal protein N' [Flavobacteriales bacterium]